MSAEPWKASVPQWDPELWAEPEEDDYLRHIDEMWDPEVGDWPEHLAGPEYWMFKKQI